MDYAIYKTNDGKHPRVIHRFTQEACNHQAKKAAKAKLLEMWQRVVKQGCTYGNNADGSKEDEFSYDHMTSTTTKERIRFYIAKL